MFYNARVSACRVSAVHVQRGFGCFQIGDRLAAFECKQMRDEHFRQRRRRHERRKERWRIVRKDQRVIRVQRDGDTALSVSAISLPPRSTAACATRTVSTEYGAKLTTTFACFFSMPHNCAGFARDQTH